MKIFYNEFCKAMYFLILGILLSPLFYNFDVRSLGVGTLSITEVDPTPMFFSMTELPSLIDIQRMLNKIEPDNPIKVDGRWGKLTSEKWDRAYCKQSAAKYDYYYERERK